MKNIDRKERKNIKRREKSKEQIISMYFKGRWFDLSLREALVERDEDPLSSLDIQVVMIGYSLLCIRPG
jgi:uncharacterized protein (DUF1015 family)